MKITMLGTGNALVTEIYNTCYVITDEETNRHMLVDAGGGNTVLTRLKAAGIDWKEIRDIFVTHKHIDHILGIVWMMRMILQNMREGNYEGEAYIYAHDEVIAILENLAKMLLNKKDLKGLGTRLHLVTVNDGETREIIGHPFTFFDIGSTKAKQYGYVMEYGDGKRLTCCGEEPYCDIEEPYAQGADYLMHEAFCLYGQADIFHPYEKHHSTALDAAKLAEGLGVKNLILYHTEEKNIADRKELYTAEAKSVFRGNVFVPEDMEIIEL